MEYFVFFGLGVLFPLWLQTVMGYTPIWAGMLTAPVGVLALILTPFIGANLNRIDLRLMLTVSFLVFSATSLWYSHFDLSVGPRDILFPRFIQGIAITLFFIPINQIILSEIPNTRLAAASGISTFFRSIGGSFATAIMITLWQQRAKYHHEMLMSNVNSYNPEYLQYHSALINQAGLPANSANAYMESLVNTQGFMIATQDIFYLSSILFLLLIPVIWLAKATKPSTTIHME